MNIYLVSRTDNIGYDEYDSIVVAAESEEDARIIDPSDFSGHVDNLRGTYDADGKYISCHDNWPMRSNVHELEVKKVGVADANVIRGLILSSYNAG